MTTPSYNTTGAFDLYVRDQLSSTEATVRLAAQFAGERAVDEYMQRSCAAAGSASARLYVPSGTDVLRIHDCTTVTAVTISSAAVASTTYQKEPVAVSWTGQTRPYEQLRLLNSCWYVIVPGEATISVTGTWGWAAVPDEVAEAALIIGKDILQQRDTVGNMVSTGDFGGSVRLNTYVRRLLDPLRRVEAFGIG